MRTTRIVLWGLGWLAIFLGSLMAQDKDTLWTKLSAEGRSVFLSWNKNHPWDQQLGHTSTNLMAKYATESGRDAVEVVGTAASVTGETRTLRFTLAEDVRGLPRGPVCLFIQTQGKILPVRKANRAGDDTAGFRYEAWEGIIRKRAETRVIQAKIAKLEQNSKTAESSTRRQEGVIRQHQWDSEASCEKITVPTETVVRPIDAIDLTQQDDVARHVCVRQVWYRRQVIKKYVNDGDIEEILTKNPRAAKEILSELLTPFLGSLEDEPDRALSNLVANLGLDNQTVKARLPQINEFLADWKKLSPGIKDYRPQFGQERDYLKWPSTASAAAFRVYGAALAQRYKTPWALDGVTEGTVQDKESVLGASLDAYSSCMRDGKVKMKIAYDNWNKATKDAPQFSVAARNALVKECHQAFQLFDTVKVEKEAIETQLSVVRSQLMQAPSTSLLPSKAQSLNASTCSP